MVDPIEGEKEVSLRSETNELIAYHAEVTMAGLKDENSQQLVVKTEPVTSLRAPKSLVLNLSQTGAVSGETTANVDSVTISLAGE